MRSHLSEHSYEELDREDELSGYRDKFYIPRHTDGSESVYLCGNSLGLQPKSTQEYLNQELKDWQNLGVEGHFHAKNPWMPYHEFLTDKMARVVGALPSEVVVMNTLTANLHFLMVSFYRPTKARNKILIESDAFPSDKYAVQSQCRFHGYDDGVLEISPREGEVLLRDEDILETIEQHGDEIALVLLGNPNYYTGQVLNMKAIAEVGHRKGCIVGFDLAHGAGNLKLDLHDSGIDFAAWCTYKYLNSGPGSVGGAFVHERHHTDREIPRFAGWWGHNKQTRFNMRHAFDPISTVEAWQLSNPPILSLAAIMASLDIFDAVGIDKLRQKSLKISRYLMELLDKLEDDRIRVINPRKDNRRGSQVSIQVRSADKSLFDAICSDGVIADWREPDVIRVAPTALYSSYADVARFVEILEGQLKGI